MVSLNAVCLSVLSVAAAAKPRTYKSFKPYPQDIEDNYNVLKWTGGVGPYTNRPGNGISPEPPAGCEVEQVVIMARHGERYPSSSDASNQRRTFQKIVNSKDSFEGSLAFLNDPNYKFYISEEGYAGLETETGPYSGLANWYGVGADYAVRYGHLWDKDSITPIFVAGYERVLQSARKFGEGFFGYNYSTAAAINVLGEHTPDGANTLSPRICPKPDWTQCNVKNQSVLAPDASGFIFPEYDIAALRLNEENGLNLNSSDIFQLLMLASFEISVKGDSPWIDVFTTEEWITFEYAMDLWMHCYFGPGSQRAQAIGATYINATLRLLEEGPEGSSLPLVFNFAHDTDIASALAAAGFVEPLRPLRTDRVTFNTGYRITDIVPMGARFTIERLRCKAPGLSNNTNVIDANSTAAAINVSSLAPWANDTYTNITAFANGTYAPFGNVTNGTVPLAWNTTLSNSTTWNSTTVNSTSSGNSSSYTNSSSTSTSSSSDEDAIFIRVLLNEAVLPLDECYDGPGFSCSLENYGTYIRERIASRDYVEVCDPPAGVPTAIEFYWNYNTTTDLNYQDGDIPWQQGML